MEISELSFVVLLSFLQLAVLIQLYFLFTRHRLLSNKTNPAQFDSVQLPVSVIICARNEEDNLRNNLPAILGQNYPQFEVVVVNDCSFDDSETVLRDFAAEFPNLKIVTITEHKRFKHGKKFAVTLGIKAASNEHLLFTDADCVPESKDWISKMQQHFQGSEIVLGYSPYASKAGLLNRIIRFETVFTAINYLSFALAGKPYMGVGRNMAYTKSLFFKSKGFASHMHIPSGDDDLFVNENATAGNTAIEISPESFVCSEPKTSFAAWFRQKIRHLGAGKAYKPTDRWVLSMQVASATVFYGTLIALICIRAQWYVVAGAYIIRLLPQWIIYSSLFKKLKCKDLIWMFPALDLIYNFFIIVLSIISLFRKNIKWK